MGKTTKNSGEKKGVEQEPSFEEALDKLRAIVESMESDELPLETLLGKYEEGSELVRVCRDKLEKAELRIQELDGTASGEAELRDIRDDDEAQE